MSESCNVFRAGKDPCVSGDSAEDAGIFVLHFSLDHAMTEAWIVGGRRDLRTELFRRIESCIDHAQRSENFALAKSIERFISEALEGDAKDDESYVAVIGTRSRISPEPHGESRMQQFIASVGLEE